MLEAQKLETFFLKFQTYQHGCVYGYVSVVVLVLLCGVVGHIMSSQFIVCRTLGEAWKQLKSATLLESKIHLDFANKVGYSFERILCRDKGWKFLDGTAIILIKPKKRYV